MKNHTLFTLLLAVFIALLGIGIIVPVMPVSAKDLGATGFGLGMIIAAFSVTRGLLQPVIGHASDKVGRKNFLIAGVSMDLWGLPRAYQITASVVLLLATIASAMIGQEEKKNDDEVKVATD